LSSTFDLDPLLRRVKPARRRAPLRRRAALAFVPDDVAAADLGPVLLDSCVYLDGGKGRLPPGARRLIAGAPVFHCSVCLAELAYAFGRLDPFHPDTPATLAFLRGLLGRVRIDRTVAPDRETWLEAAVIAGTLARTQGLAPADRRRLMYDALVFLAARRIGHPVLTANAGDFDLIQQLAPNGRVVYYRPVAPGATDDATTTP
jgi:predicted nucleic acid-binding protein